MYMCVYMHVRAFIINKRALTSFAMPSFFFFFTTKHIFFLFLRPLIFLFSSHPPSLSFPETSQRKKIITPLIINIIIIYCAAPAGEPRPLPCNLGDILLRTCGGTGVPPPPCEFERAILPAAPAKCGGNCGIFASGTLALPAAVNPAAGVDPAFVWGESGDELDDPSDVPVSESDPELDPDSESDTCPPFPPCGGGGAGALNGYVVTRWSGGGRRGRGHVGPLRGARERAAVRQHVRAGRQRRGRRVLQRRPHRAVGRARRQRPGARGAREVGLHARGREVRGRRPDAGLGGEELVLLLAGRAVLLDDVVGLVVDRLDDRLGEELKVDVHGARRVPDHVLVHEHRRHGELERFAQKLDVPLPRKAVDRALEAREAPVLHPVR